jgi:hypothetical protein
MRDSIGPRLVTFGVALPSATYSTFDRQLLVYQRLMDRLGAMPGIDKVSIASGLPPQRRANGFGRISKTRRRGRTCWTSVDYYQTVTAGYFEAMRIPIVRGRTFREADRIGAPVAVVNETFARTFWNDLDPIGRHVRPRFGNQTPWVAVVGWRRMSSRAGSIEQPAPSCTCWSISFRRAFPTLQALTSFMRSITNSGAMNIVVRSGLPMATLQPAIASAVRETDPVAPDYRAAADGRRDQRLGAKAAHVDAPVGGFAGLAVVLDSDRHLRRAVVPRDPAPARRSASGWRSARGRETVLRSVMAHGLTFTLIGVAAGLAPRSC